MINIKNRIITLSGQPAAGKSALRDELIKEYEKLGFEVKEFSTGEKFREYFNDMIELLIAIKNKETEKINELSQRESIKKIMYNSIGQQKPESVQLIKDTLSTMEERNFDFDSFDIEKANNSVSLSKIREQIDFSIDNYMKEDLRNYINSEKRPNTIWIIDSRLAWNNIPKDESFSVRLIADEKITGKRAYDRFLTNFDNLINEMINCNEIDTTNLNITEIDDLQAKFEKMENIINNSLNVEIKTIYLAKLIKVKEEAYESLEQAIGKIAARKKGENDRYKERYNVDLDNPNNYKLIVDTSNLTVEEEAKMIIEAEQKLYTEKGYISPKDKDEYDGEDR